MKPRMLTIGHSYVVALNRSVMRELQRRGNIDVTLLAPRFFAGDLRAIHMEPEDSELDVRPIDCYMSSRVHLFFYNQKQIHQVLQERNWSYGYLWEEPYIVSGFQMARAFHQSKIPFSFFTNQNIFKKYPLPFSYFEKKTLQWCESLWGCGPQVLETFRQKNYTGAQNLIPYFVNVEKFSPFSAEQKRHAKQRLGLSADKVIGFMGRLTEEKGCRLFLQTLEGLRDRSDWQALILGAGPMEGEIRQWLAERNLTNQVIIKLVKHDEVPQTLAVMDVLLCPSQTTPFWREQFGRMLIEAFASGVPVMASDSGEIPYVVGNAGVILPEKDETKWFDSLRDLLFDDKKLHELRERGLARAQMFSSQSVAKQIEQIVLASVKRL